MLEDVNGLKRSIVFEDLLALFEQPELFAEHEAATIELKLWEFFETLILQASEEFAKFRCHEQLRAEIKAPIEGWIEILNFQDSMTLDAVMKSSNSNIDAVLIKIMQESFRDQLLYIRQHNSKAAALEAFAAHWKPMFYDATNYPEVDSTQLIQNYCHGFRVLACKVQIGPFPGLSGIYSYYACALNEIADSLTDNKMCAPTRVALCLMANKCFAARARYLNRVESLQ